MDKMNLFLSANILLFDVLTILIHYFVLLFSILSQKKKFYVKRKKNTQSSCMIFFSYFMSNGHISEESHDLSKWHQNKYKKHLICHSAIQSSFRLILSVLKKNCKNNYNCPSDMCLSDIITSSRISLIIFPIDLFVS